MIVIKMERLQLLVIFLASLWSSDVHCRVHGQRNDRTDSETEAGGDNVDWPVLCPEETFYDKAKERCAVCSQCPINRVIVSPCQGLQDTRCGPFISFKLFDNSKVDGADHENIVTPTPQTEVEVDTNRNRWGQGDSSSEVDAQAPDRDSLSVLLVVILAVVLTVFALVIAITCYVRHKSSRSAKTAQLCEYQPTPTPTPNPTPV